MDTSLLYTGYSKRILKNRNKSDADLIKDDRMFRNTLKEVLGQPFSVDLGDGDVVDVPLVKVLVAKKVGYMLENPKDIDLKEISTVLGENKVEADITLRSAQDLFGDIVIDYDRTNEETE